MQAKPRRHAASATFVSLALILGLVVAGLVALSGAEAASQQPKCGDTITADTTLHRNLVNCPNNGIIIGADDLTLDLNYHTIDGDGTPASECDPRKEFCDEGVINDGHAGVTVVHGSVREFEDGVFVGRARHSRLLGISSSRNRFSGIVVIDTARSLVRNSSGSGSVTPKGGSGIFMFGSHHVRILHNTCRHNGDRGIGVFDSTHNLIRGNLLSRNHAAAIELQNANRNRVRRNRSVRDGTGVVVYGDGNVIARNRIARATQRHGRAPSDGQAIEVPRGDHNLIARNSIRVTSQHAIGFAFDEGVGNVVRRNRIREAGEDGVHVGGGAKHANVVRRNHIRGAGEDGVHVSPKAKHTLLRRNRARHSKDDGFDIEGRRSQLTRNKARRNGDLGIEAVRGVIDGGGNKASGNGDPRQCTHIACS